MARLDRHVSQNIGILAQVVADICQRSTLDEACGGTLSRNQFTILRILTARREVTIGRIARILGVSNAAASKNVDRLVRLGFVDRLATPGDRRRFAIALLPAGRAIVAGYDRIMAEKQSRLLENFTIEEKETLLDLLRRVIQHTLADDQDVDLVCFQCAGECGDECVLSRRLGAGARNESQLSDPGT
ncbi:MAG TPA: MarR family transcriptional regulator [Candidatus Krumholzibacteria bacterium]|nr:MarR family transcriptional regulator [Candidatus Krumholzibacteria bacterium]HPD73062.1 MarR family transcriptional regulator [Candidatus Krumholzibacteria bacterium]HRY41862.1 MarR family transcriptional regulator [Candidatus Krumholzibacteria bacterium]